MRVLLEATQSDIDVREMVSVLKRILDLPPENDTSYNIVKGGIDGQERLYTGTNYQQAQGS